MQKKTKIYIKLIKRLINLNLLIINPLFNISNRYTLAKLNFIFINPFEYIKNIKEFIRSLQFLNYHRFSYLYLETDKEKYEEILFLLNYNTSKLKDKIKHVDIIQKKKISNYSSVYFYLRQNIFTSDYFKNLFKNYFYMVYSVNLNFEKNRLGFYRFYTDLDETKKMIFFVSLINLFYRR
jgi:hypothetical protein